MVAPSAHFFPNIAIRLVRSALPPHQAVFRVPARTNKVDLATLLTGLYGLRVTDIRTMNYAGRSHVTPVRAGPHRNKAVATAAAAYKKAIVSLQDDFDWPPPRHSGAIAAPPTMAKGAPSRKFRHRLPPPRPDDPAFLLSQNKGAPTSVKATD
ncbi:hypothetical protein HK100_003398 [Physocladia obscura]|uniref:Large ribosomal subunit protein uL23m n=1 Tax=Physocladia obscura TaxID=109957 RepID=A0AAD5XEM1_9FUNG|nr:hypothetical protein HK100_003398 [Physocladia obscura]